MTQSYTAPIDAAQVMIFARSVGDGNERYSDQLFAAVGTPLITPPTFVRALDHFDPASTTRPALPAQQPGFGGRTDTLHAEQHFEYFAPFCAGDRVTIRSFPGARWTKAGQAGTLRFSEAITEYHNQAGSLLVRARKVSVLLPTGETDD